MAKFNGIIGYSTTVETRPGIWEEEIVEKPHRGDVVMNFRRWQPGEELNDDFTISNTISIVANSFAVENVGRMRYVIFMGAYWKINSVEIRRPRIILTIGGVYNGNKAPVS